MINHARTLLLNRPGASRPLPTYYLEEYVDPQYVPLALPGYLVQARDALLGRNPDNAYANFRLWEIFRTIDSTDYAHYVTDLDPRVTYRRRRSVVDVSHTTSYVPITPANTTKLYFAGEPGSSLVSAQLQFDWQVQVVDALVVQITSIQLQRTELQTVTITDGLTSLIPLTGQPNLYMRVACIGSLPAGAGWQVTTFAEPDGDINNMIDPLSKLGDATLVQLFPNRDPYKLFGQLWGSPIFIQDRLTGMALAYAYHADEVRRNV